jgi:hypothetical protein
LKTWWPIIAASLLLIFGNGAYWSWRELKLKTLVDTTELRNAENSIFRDIIQLAEDYFTALEQYSGNKNNIRAKNKMEQVSLQMKKRRADFDAVETKLAELESRKPESINLYFPTPTPPTSIKVVPNP